MSNPQSTTAKSPPLRQVRAPRVIKGAVFTGEHAAHATSAMRIADGFNATFEQTSRIPTAAERIEQDREEMLRSAYEEGILAAKAEVAAALEDANVRVKRLVGALSVAVDELEQRQAVGLRDVEDAIVTSAIAIAESILQREVQCTKDPGAQALARALKLAPEGGEITARLNPEDVVTLSMDSIDASSRKVSIVADPEIEPGGCILVVGDLRIDAQLSTAIAQVKQAIHA